MGRGGAVLGAIGFVARRAALGALDGIVTAPPLRWTWAGPSREELVQVLDDFRPADRDSILDMMAGRYVLASRLVDTQGLSPFAMTGVPDDWAAALRGFAWLRHFREARNDGERSFARMLTLDWIGREGRFRRPGWSVALTARRVLNWLRHLNLLTEDATPEQRKTLLRALGVQIQWLRLRSRLAGNALDRLWAAIALAAAAASDERPKNEIAARMARLLRLLEAQLDPDGLHLTRSADVQVQLLTELETLRQALLRDRSEAIGTLGETVEAMHRALDGISLAGGEPAYFNGTGQLPHDLIVALGVQNGARFGRSGTVGGYGRLMAGESVVVADGGLVPPLEFAGSAHAGALAFEFAHGADLIVGNCGPAPADLGKEGIVFRRGAAHSTVVINHASAGRLSRRGALAGRLRPDGDLPPEVALGGDGDGLVLVTHGFERRFGVTIERRLTLLSAGQTLVGQDRLTRAGKGRQALRATARLHLALGTTVSRSAGEDVLRLRLASGAVWTFLWEGATARIEDSVRQSAYFGLNRTHQIVLETEVTDGHEIAWIFTREDGTGE
jgi:uncharacterized heparinase superfamily protein